MNRGIMLKYNFIANEFLQRISGQYLEILTKIKSPLFKRNFSSAIDIQLSQFQKTHVEVISHAMCSAGTGQLLKDLPENPILIDSHQIKNVEVDSHYCVTYRDWIKEMFDPSVTPPTAKPVQYPEIGLLLANIMVMRHPLCPEIIYIVFPTFENGTFKPACQAIQ